MLASLAQRLSGSPVEFNHSGRAATSSINLISAHDGFTLADVVSFNERHNEANGENNRDGHTANHSDNLGTEGPTEDSDISARRSCRRRALIATLMLSQGVPMLLGGDELSNSQGGNNNSYCQDNATGWLDWTTEEPEFIEFCQAVIGFRNHYSLLRQSHFLDQKGARWFGPDGNEMSDEEWHSADNSVVGMRLLGQSEEIDLLLVFNSGEECHFTLPDPGEAGLHWRRVLDSAANDFADRLAARVEQIARQSVVAFAACEA